MLLPMAGLASIAGAKEKRYFHASRFVGVEMILRRILKSTVARAAWRTLVMSEVQGGVMQLCSWFILDVIGRLVCWSGLVLL